MAFRAFVNPLTRAGRADVTHVAEVHIVEDTQYTGRQLDDRRTVFLEIQKTPGLERGVVPGQHQWFGIRHAFGDHDLIRFCVADITLTLTQVIHRYRGCQVYECLDGAGTVDIVVNRISSGELVSRCTSPKTGSPNQLSSGFSKCCFALS